MEKGLEHGVGIRSLLSSEEASDSHRHKSLGIWGSNGYGSEAIISTLADYVKPLIDYLQNLPEEEKVIVISTVLPQVILVGHSCGGASISYALECCPKKISKAIFVCATMVSDGKKPFDVFAEERAESQGKGSCRVGKEQEMPRTEVRTLKDALAKLEA
ncbi:hypothetical protein IFM89_000951 [Coptis chinensis]|uniref:AB hydrolase-1 domain-containing protein n=1 Tax=Coptis chinensis TaxID=261450 RepID=A0A835IIB7_9MAGN|nr:hypothetical protein IFM89_000951 [Coptis chinensis]